MRLQSLVQFESLLDNQPHLKDDFKSACMSSAHTALSKVSDSDSPATCLRAIIANLSDTAVEVIFHM